MDRGSRVARVGGRVALTSVRDRRACVRLRCRGRGARYGVRTAPDPAGVVRLHAEERPETAEVLATVADAMSGCPVR